MSQRHDTGDELRRLDPLDGRRLADFWSDSEAKQALFQEITTVPTTDTEPKRTSGLSRRAFVLAATIAILSLAAVGGAVLQAGDVTETTHVACHTPDGAVAAVDATTGDPVVDCRHLWEAETGRPAPDLTAYDNGSGGIEVLPAGEDVPDGWTALDRGVIQDPTLIELEAALDDAGSGLRSDCMTEPEARQVVDRELDRLGLDSWSVVAERGAADGTRTCSYFWIRPTTQEIALIPSEGLVSPDEDPIQRFARAVSRAVDDRCLTTREAADTALRLAADNGIDLGEGDIREVADSNVSCARAHVSVGGAIQVILRGPPS